MPRNNNAGQNPKLTLQRFRIGKSRSWGCPKGIGRGIEGPAGGNRRIQKARPQSICGRRGWNGRGQELRQGLLFLLPMPMPLSVHAAFYFNKDF